MPNRWDEGNAARAAAQALELSKAFLSKLEPRLPAGFFDGLKSDADIARAGGDVPASRSQKEAATVSQDVAVREGAVMVSTIRELVRRGAPKNKQLWRAFGVGARFTPSVKTVSSALAGILAAASTYPSETQAMGVLAEDLARIQGYLTSIADIDADQEAKKLTSKQATAQLKAAVERLAQKLTLLASIARLALPARDAELFDRVLPSSPKAKPKAPAPT
ncbi:MAG: hypothetical protein ABTQ32_16850 [Myxococcaceae bacterium]